MKITSYVTKLSSLHYYYTVCIKKRLVFEIQIRHILLNSSDKYGSCQMNSIEYAKFEFQRLAFFMIHPVDVQKTQLSTRLQ